MKLTVGCGKLPNISDWVDNLLVFQVKVEGKWKFGLRL